MSKISVKIKKKKSVNPDKPMPVYLQIIYRRKTGYIPLEYKLSDNQWDAKKECILIPPGSEPGQVLLLHSINEKLKEKQRHILALAHTLEAKDLLSVSTLLSIHRERNKVFSLSSFMQQLIRQFAENGQDATSRHYQSTLNKFILFSETKGMQLADINETVIKQFESYLVEKKLAPNTVSFYLRIMQATWNKAVNMGLLPNDPSPFRQVNTRVEKTIKRAVEEKVIIRLANLTGKELQSPALQFARDMFLFSYYARGMSYIDIAFLKKENIRGNTLVYKRRKTGQELKIRLLPEMKAIIKRYAGKNRAYLFPILDDDAVYRNYESALRWQNKQLKILGELVGVHLTTYVARHTWASIASQKGIPLELISKGLGHTSEKVTHIYIAMLDNPRLDRANDVVIHGKMKYKNKTDMYAFG
ncbi:phage integrase SAM-like domain-containing protein [Parabacteroides sp.]